MSMNCEVVLRWDALPEQLRALGAALWGWCNRASGDAGIYQYLDNQALADLLEGRLPAPGPTSRSAGLPHVHFLVRGDPAGDCQATLESLWRALPAEGVAEVRVDGLSQRPAEANDRTTRAQEKNDAIRTDRRASRGQGEAGR
jgi:hypothetical protein